MKIKILLILVFVLSLMAVILGLAAIQTSTPSEVTINLKKDEDEYSSNQSTQEVDLFSKNLSGYEYAAITPDDTIALINKLGEKVIINLERKSWKNISWSPGGELVAVLGETGSSVYDIYIFEIKSRTWVQATNFVAFGVGVDSYTWKGSEQIDFTQGLGKDKWLHSYNHNSRSILKIVPTPAKIIEYSKLRKYLVLKDEVEGGISYHVHDNLGNKLLELNNFVDSMNSDIKYKITRLFSITDNEKVVFSVGKSQFAKSEVGSLTATLMDVEDKDYSFLCAINDYEYYFTELTDENINLYILNTRRERMNLISARESLGSNMSVVDNTATCFDQRSVLFAVTANNSSTEWLEYRNGTNNLANLFHLKGLKEVKVK